MKPPKRKPKKPVEVRPAFPVATNVLNQIPEDKAEYIRNHREAVRKGKVKRTVLARKVGLPKLIVNQVLIELEQETA